jgi:OOP family OmpA-OmpF porin
MPGYPYRFQRPTGGQTVTRIAKLCIAASVALALAACSGMTADVASVKGMQAQGSDFNKALFGEYVGRAEVERAEGDFTNANVFLGKARPITKGELMLPEEPGGWKLPAGALDELTPARARLVSALDRNGRGTMPALAARAQRLYDCWVEEWSENIQPDDIAACRAGFEKALAQLEEGLKPKPVAAAPPPPPPPPPPAPEPLMFTRDVIERFIVYFDFDSTHLTGQSLAVVRQAAESVANAKSYDITVRGHTDRAGSNAYNEKLAKERTGAVASGLSDFGIPAGQVEMLDFGERQPAVPTGDGVRERNNRRVEIMIDKKVEVTIKPAS